MGIFSRKKKATPLLAPSPVMPTPPSPVIAYEPPPRPTLRLRVAIDPLPLDSQGSDSFCIDVELDEGVQAVRRAVQKKIGAVGVAIFKTAIPLQAIEQSREYTNRYSTRVDLVTLFPCFSVDQPSQLYTSLGAAAWQAPTVPAQPTVRDWFPAPVDTHHVISILVRPCPSLSAGMVPLTLLAHYAPVESTSSSSRSSRPSTASSPTSTIKPLRRPPTVVDISSMVTVDELKRRILEAGNVQVEASRMDRVVLWKVDMSEGEMVVIEERGGLKGGQMPWPYPPTAEVPVKLDNSTERVDKYWTNSNPRMVALSVWVPRPSSTSSTLSVDSTSSAGSATTEDVPVFTYPMTFPIEQRRASASHSLPNRSPTPDIPVIVTANTLPASSRSSARRGRPSTAPATIDASGSGTAQSFGAPAFGTRRARSPLAPRVSMNDSDSTDIKGLGIGAPDDVNIDMSKLRLNVYLGPESTEDGKIVWYQPSGGRTPLKRTNTSRSYRSLSHNKSLQPHEVV